MKKRILAALALSLALPACALGEAGYTAGTYSAEAQGMESASPKRRWRAACSAR